MDIVQVSRLPEQILSSHLARIHHYVPLHWHDRLLIFNFVIEATPVPALIISSGFADDRFRNGFCCINSKSHYFTISVFYNTQ